MPNSALMSTLVRSLLASAASKNQPANANDSYDDVANDNEIEVDDEQEIEAIPD
jgi:hypothetical protein